MLNEDELAGKLLLAPPKLEPPPNDDELPPKVELLPKEDELAPKLGVLEPKLLLPPKEVELPLKTVDAVAVTKLEALLAIGALPPKPPNPPKAGAVVAGKALELDAPVRLLPKELLVSAIVDDVKLNPLFPDVTGVGKTLLVVETLVEALNEKAGRVPVVCLLELAEDPILLLVLNEKAAPELDAGVGADPGKLNEFEDWLAKFVGPVERDDEKLKLG